jgi:putative hydrolase of the HAD superfamily
MQPESIINRAPRQWKPDWRKIETVLLDMDGTLLDKHFDDYFWESYVPAMYAAKNGLTPEEARKHLLAKYKKNEGTLAWTDLDYWSLVLDLDIPALKIQVDHLIQIHPYVIDFLKYCRNIGKKIHLVTNAHSKTLVIKMRKTAIGKYFDRIICAEEVGLAKEDPLFWQRLQDMLQFAPASTLLADDNEKVLLAAREYGLQTLIYVARPSSQGPITYSEEFPSIVYFKELILTFPAVKN